MREVIAAARQVTGLPIPVEIAPRRPGDPPALVGSADKARQILDWSPQYAELPVIIDHAWRWHQHRQGQAG